MGRRLNDYNYELPRELIAQHPLPRREDSRMMVLHRDRKKIEHAHFVDLKKFLRDDDVLVLNNSRVLPARHFSDEGKFEFLCLEKIAPCRWKALVKPSRKFGKGAATFIQGVCAEGGEIFADGSREIVLSDDIDLQHGGAMPLPPYIKRPAVVDPRYKAEDEARYQTVFAKYEGSLAAPTAGRVVAVGTTTVRVLESVKRRFGKIQASQGETNIFIYPPFQFRVVDVLLTNFHLPRPPLLLLVSAFAGREFILRAYEESVRERYRFFSYGDCMLIL